MQKKLLFAALFAIICTNLSAIDTFDMGKIEVIGKDAQSQKINPVNYQIDFKMNERFAPPPQITPEVPLNEYTPLEFKEVFQNIHKEQRDELSLIAGLGTRGAKEFILNAKGTSSGYIGELEIEKSERDGYRATTNTSSSLIEASITNNAFGTYSVTGTGSYGTNKFAQPGAQSRPTPNASIEDKSTKFTVSGNSTLKDGAFTTGFISAESISRDSKSPEIGFNEEALLDTYSLGFNYLKPIHEKLTGKARILTASEKVDVSNAPNVKLSAVTLEIGTDYEINHNTSSLVGLRYNDMKNVQKTSPFTTLTHRPSDNWEINLSYEEKLGNNNLKKIFMPERYVLVEDFRASSNKIIKTGADYRLSNKDLIGFEFFSEKETDAIEYIDDYDPAKVMLVSRLRTIAQAKRKGTALKGSFKIDKTMLLKVQSTFQKAEDTNIARSISYEPDRILDVGLNYTENKLMIDFNRRAEFGRKAHTTAGSFNVEDYSRSDLIARYKFSDRYKAYIKIQDLYNEAKVVRYDVPEEGRVSVFGLEAHF